MRISVCLAAFGVLILAGLMADQSAQAAEKAEWALVSVTEVPVKQRTVTIPLGKHSGKFRAFRLTSGGSRYTVLRSRVRYLDGKTRTVRRRFHLRPGRKSFSLSSLDQAAFADEISFTFRVSRSGRGEREVELWGLRTPEEKTAGMSGSDIQSAATTDESEAGTAGAETETEETGIGAIPVKAEPTPTAKAEKTPAEPERTVIANLTPPAPARPIRGSTAPAGDVLIAARAFPLQTARQTITAAGRIGKFKRIRFRVLEHPLRVRSLTISYADGSTERFELDQTVGVRQASQWLDIEADRFVDTVAFDHVANPGSAATARVEIFGDLSPDWLAEDGEGSKHNDGWVILAAQTAGFVGFERDEIAVGTNAGGFKELKVAVRDRSITLNALEIEYRDGKTDSIAVRARVGAGKTFGPIALNSGDKAISRIHAHYRSRFIDRSAPNGNSAIVEVWARH